MANTVRTQIRAHGIRVLLARHPEVRKLKKVHTPSYHGSKHWPSSWLLIDYFKGVGLLEGTRVMEVGCGWGLAGIYCAKKHRALVTGVDKDPEVFPYLQLHAGLNKVEIATMEMSFAGLTGKLLQGVDVLIGADICFWDNMVDPLKKLVLRALQAGVHSVVIADPGRSTFEKTAKYLVGKQKGEVLDWTTRRPRPIQGRILRIDQTSA